jgi:phenylpropionate dioxygenase-like ring-hydroxylating dioxygenase large terminal subunit
MTEMATTRAVLDDQAVVQRIFDHIDNRTTDLSETTSRVPVEHYRSPQRLRAELESVLRRYPTPFCPSAALPDAGSYLARAAAGTPLVAVRGQDGQARAFRNACRHRGTQLADGAGCAKAFVCPYHGWTYGLDGRLQHVPHEHGFPGLDKGAFGLVPVETVERCGLVFVTQETPALRDACLDELPPLIPPSFRLLAVTEQEIGANWKILMDAFLEGYHIRFTHRDTFYPVQFDNLNVIETFGRNHRVTFPYRSIAKLRSVPPAERRVDGRVLTYVYHLFPNVTVATFPEQIKMIAVEPLATDRTKFIIYTLTGHAEREAAGLAELERATDFSNEGGREDGAVALAIQRGLASGANEFFEFGRFEGALSHFHHTLQVAIEEGGPGPRSGDLQVAMASEARRRDSTGMAD